MLKQIFNAAVLAACVLVTSTAQAHSGGHEPVPPAVAMQIAGNVAAKLAERDRGMGFGQLAASWKTIPAAAITVKKQGGDYYIIDVHNAAEKRTLSVLMSPAGEVYDANFTGTFPGLSE